MAQPIKGAAHRFAYLGLVIGAFALMMLGKADVVLMEKVRGQLTDSLVPIMDVLSRPAAAVANIVRQVEELAHLHGENTRLQEENTRLLHWQAMARKLDSENGALRGLLNFIPDDEISFVSGRVIADSGGAFVRSLLLNAGARDGVRKGQAVTTGEGLVGRVADVGARSSRVLLLSDLNSRIPVVVESTRTRAVLAGNNRKAPQLIHLPPSAEVSVGDRIATSGHGGAFPPGLPVGVVSSVGESGIAVTPFVEPDALEYVRVVDFGLRGILPSTKGLRAPARGDRAAGR